MRIPKFVRVSAPWAIVAAVGVTAFLARGQWLPLLSRSTAESSVEDSAAPVEEPKVLKLTPQARKNLQLTAQPARPQTYRRMIQVPGAIVDRPGRSRWRYRGLRQPT